MSIHPNCHFITIIGGKGGVGKSVFAANLAFALLGELRAKVLLVDLDARSCGDQNIITGLRPKKTVAEVSNFTGVITPQSLETLVTPHPSGLHYIGAVMSPEQTLNASPALFKKQIGTISQYYNFIIADLGNDIGDLQTAALEDASAILTLTTPEVLAVNQTKRLMHDLIAKTVPQEFFQLVVNNVGRTGLDPRLISQTLNRPVQAMIPQDDITVYASVQRSTPFVASSPQTPVAQAYFDLVRRLTGGVLQKLKTLAKPKSIHAASNAPATTVAPITEPSKNRLHKSKQREISPLGHLKLQVHSALIREMDLKKDLSGTQGDPVKEQELRNKTQKAISQIVDRIGGSLGREDRAAVIKQVVDEALGLGPLEELLADPTVTEIMVNGSDKIYIEKSGRLQLSPITFTSNLQLRNVIERIVTPLGRRIDEKTPYCDARLQDGSRVNAVIEPLSIDGPALTIRKFPSERITMDDYVQRYQSLTQPMAEFLKVCVEEGLNVIISGGTGTGKTTLLNVLSGFIPTSERIVTIEDAAELQLKQDHVVRLETRPANMEGSGEITIRDLVRNALRMRPDRIVVGECRDGAALDMLQAMNTGHDGSMTTVHANTPREATSRLETLCLMAGMDLPAKAIRDQIGSAINLIVQITRFSDGSRKISSVTEVVGMMGEAMTLQEVFRYKDEGFDKNRRVVGQFQATGLIPTFIEKFESRGITIPRNLFTTTASAPAKPSAVKAAAAPMGSAKPAASPKPTPAPIKKASGGDST